MWLALSIAQKVDHPYPYRLAIVIITHPEICHERKMTCHLYKIERRVQS